MLIDLARMDDSTVEFELQVEGKDIDLSSRFCEASGTTSFGGTVKKVDWYTIVNGSAEVRFKRRCDRCYRASQDEVSLDFEQVFVPAESLTEDRETDLEICGLEYSVLENNQLELKQVLAEMVLVEMPDKYVCDADCKGVCPECGKPT